MANINTSSFASALKPIINEAFGEYDMLQRMYPKVFEVIKSQDGYEIDKLFPGFGLPGILSESAPRRYESTQQGYEARYDHVEYQNGFVVSRNAMMDLKNPFSIERLARQLRVGMEHGRELIAANVLNNAFSGSYVGGDAVSLCSASHPTQGADMSNTPVTQSALAEPALEQAIIDIEDIRDDKGLRANLKAVQLIVPSALRFQAERLSKSDLRVNTANNDINAIRNRGDIKKNDPLVWNFLSSSTAWFIQTSAMNGLKMYEREDIHLSDDNDFSTRNMLTSAEMRFAVGWTDPRGIYGSQGTV
jgi:hypothetical protein